MQHLYSVITDRSSNLTTKIDSLPERLGCADLVSLAAFATNVEF